jgi:2'-5' RNA ligase
MLVPALMDSMYKKHDSSYIYLGLAGDTPSLKDIYKSLSSSLSQISIPQPVKFFPHITIARYIKADPVTIKSAMDTVSDFEFTPLSEFTVGHLSLYESLLSQKGSHFRRLGEFLLRQS